MMQRIQCGVLLVVALATVWVAAVPTPRAMVSTVDATGCDCQDTYTCGCCVNLDIPQLNISETGCANVTYVKDEKLFQFSLTFNDQTIFEKDVSLANIPPVCAGLRQLLQVCSQVYDLDLEEDKISGCLELDLWARGELVRNITLGCFSIPVGVASNALKFQPYSPLMSILPAQKVNPQTPQELPQDWEGFVRMAAQHGEGPLFLGLHGLLNGFGDALQRVAANQANKQQK